MENTTGPSLRVLTRPSATSSASSDSLPSFPCATIPLPSSSSSLSPLSGGQSHSSVGQPPSANGVVVVGVVGRSQDDVTQLLNRILDAQIFGFGNRDRGLWNDFSDDIRKARNDGDGNGMEEAFRAALQEEGILEDGFNEDVKCKEPDMGSSRREAAWIRKKRISYYLDEEKGIVYVQFAWGSPHMDLLMEDSQEFPSILDRHETDDLCGLLVMFSVCHIIVFIHEGARFDTQILKTFRTLQAAKHALSPYVKTQVLPGLLPVPASSTRGTTTRPMSAPSSSSPGRGGIIGRHASTIQLMSGSSPTLFPGQCTPVMLFVFLDDFTDGSASGSHGTTHQEDTVEAAASGNLQGTSGPQYSGLVHISRSNLQSKASNPVVMLARSASKMEGGFRKKLQSSLEVQIRFLIKKCRTITGGGDGGPTAGLGLGPRGPGNVSSLSGAGIGGTLFALDAARAVALVDRSSNRKGESLDAAVGVIEDILNGKEGSENLLLENSSNGGVSEDIQTVKDFLYRQAEVLRGRGGIATNSTSGSVGVGMVAAAAAAAAASAAAGGSGGTIKAFSSPPELPSLVNWLSACHLLFEALGTTEYTVADKVKGASTRGPEGSINYQKKEFQEPASSGRMGGGLQTGQGALEMAIACLESGKGLDMKFSAAWCERALPAAKEVYMKGLPPCYPTALHKSQLEKALRAFRAMVRGPAVHLFPQKLKEDCEAIWKSGRQLCDAISLTGKPCVHETHDVTLASSTESAESEKAVVKSHSSGFVFLHACACGRSRRLRNDPFDFESANVTFFHFPNCEDLLPSFSMPNVEYGKPLGGSAWSLVRLGGQRYYQPSAGVLQSGFCANENFLSAWTITFAMQDAIQNVLVDVQQKEAVPPSSVIQDSVLQIADTEEQTKVSSVIVEAIPPEVRVLGKEQQRKSTEKAPADDTKLNSSRGFPVSEMKKPFAEVVAKSNCNTDSAFPPLQQNRQQVPVPERNGKQRSGKERKDQVVHGVNDDASSTTLKMDTVKERNPQNAETGGQREENSVLQVGSNTLPIIENKGERPLPSIGMKHVVVYLGFEHECSYGHRFLLSLEHLEKLSSPYTESTNCGGLEKPADQAAFTLKQAKQAHKHMYSSDMQNITESRAKWANSTQDMVSNQHGQSISHYTKLTNTEMKCQGDLPRVIINEGEGPGFSLLNMNLPIYMNCPHCKTSTKSKKQHSLKFASTISQLQRIFLVTPPFPTVLATCPVVQFEGSCLPASLQQVEQCSRFSLGCRVVLPPESFLSLRFPFVYGARLDDGSPIALLPRAYKPELTAWLVKGTTLQIVSKGNESDAVFSI
eukprot:Gb_15944 [translate_table: standard]